MLIKFNEARILDALGTKIIPGVQEVSSEFFEKAMKNKTLRYKFENNLLEVVDGGSDAISSFLVMAPAKIKDVIKHTNDLQLLSNWRAREVRESVKAIIEVRIKQLQTVEYRDGTKGILEVPPPQVPAVGPLDIGDDLELDEAPVKKPAVKKRSK